VNISAEDFRLASSLPIGCVLRVPPCRFRPLDLSCEAFALHLAPFADAACGLKSLRSTIQQAFLSLDAIHDDLNSLYDRCRGLEIHPQLTDLREHRLRHLCIRGRSLSNHACSAEQKLRQTDQDWPHGLPPQK
jgi:hypothetical protein